MFDEEINFGWDLKPFLIAVAGSIVLLLGLRRAVASLAVGRGAGFFSPLSDFFSDGPESPPSFELSVFLRPPRP